MCPTFLSLVDFYVPFAAVCSTAGEKEEEEGFLVPLSTRVGFPANYYYVDMKNFWVGLHKKKGVKNDRNIFFLNSRSRTLKNCCFLYRREVPYLKHVLEPLT